MTVGMDPSFLTICLATWVCVIENICRAIQRRCTIPSHSQSHLYETNTSLIRRVRRNCVEDFTSNANDESINGLAILRVPIPILSEVALTHCPEATKD
jgi:hypothetical protein